jgi:hypothetical protein
VFGSFQEEVSRRVILIGADFKENVRHIFLAPVSSNLQWSFPVVSREYPTMFFVDV